MGTVYTTQLLLGGHHGVRALRGLEGAPGDQAVPPDGPGQVSQSGNHVSSTLF